MGFFYGLGQPQDCLRLVYVSFLPFFCNKYQLFFLFFSLIKNTIHNLIKTMLSPSKEEKKSSKIDIEKLLGYIQKGCKQIRQEVDHSILVIGDTGSGKSTFINLMLGNQLKPQKSGLNKFKYVLSEDQKGPIIGDKTISETSIPWPWVKDNETIFWDCPGFEDTRGIEQDIANGYYIKKIFEESSQIKVIIVVSQKDFEDRAKELLILIKRIGDMFQNLEYCIDGIGLIVTKVEQGVLPESLLYQFKRIFVEQQSRQNFTQKQRIFYSHILDNRVLQVFYKPNNNQQNNLQDQKQKIQKLLKQAKYINSPKINIPLSYSSKSHLQALQKDCQIQYEKKQEIFFDRFWYFIQKQTIVTNFQNLKKLINCVGAVSDILLTAEEVNIGKLKNYQKSVKKLSQVLDGNQCASDAIQMLNILKFVKQILGFQLSTLSKVSHSIFIKLKRLLITKIQGFTSELQQQYEDLICQAIVEIKNHVAHSLEEGRLQKFIETIKKVIMFDNKEIIVGFTEIALLSNYDCKEKVIEAKEELERVNRSLKSLDIEGFDCFDSLRQKLCEILILTQNKLEIYRKELHRKQIQEQHDIKSQLLAKLRQSENKVEQLKQQQKKILKANEQFQKQKKAIQIQLKKGTEELKQRIFGLQIELAGSKSQQQLLKKQNKLLQENHADFSKKMNQKLEYVQDERQKLKQQLNRLQIDKEQKNKYQNQRQIASMNEINALKLSIEEYKNREAQLKMKLQTKGEKIDELKDNVNKLTLQKQQNINLLSNQNLSLKKVVEELTEDKQNLQQQLEQYSSKLEQAEQKSQKYEAELKKNLQLKGLLEGIERNIKYYESRIIQLEKQIKDKDRNFSEIKDKFHQYQSIQKYQSNQKRSEAEALRKRLEGQIQSSKFLNIQHRNIVNYYANPMILQQSSRLPTPQQKKRGIKRSVTTSHWVRSWTDQNQKQLQKQNQRYQRTKSALYSIISSSYKKYVSYSTNSSSKNIDNFIKIMKSLFEDKMSAVDKDGFVVFNKGEFFNHLEDQQERWYFAQWMLK